MKSSRITIFACISLIGIVPVASATPARFWLSKSKTETSGPESPTVKLVNGRIQELYIWGRPGISEGRGATSLQSFSVDLVTKDASVGNFRRDGIPVYGPSRFETVVDTQHGFPQFPTDDFYIDDSQTMTSLLTLGINDEGIRGVAAYSIFNSGPGGFGPVNDQPCNSSTFCAMDPMGNKAWLVASVTFQTTQSSGTAKYHLQVGYNGMKYYDPTLDDTEPRESPYVVFGTDEDQVMYDAGLCENNGTCPQRQRTYDHDTVDLTIQALPPPGDYGRDSLVGPEDYAMWQHTFGNQVTDGADADGNVNGVIDAGDYTLWRDHLEIAVGDFNRDLRVGAEDFSLWKSTFGNNVGRGTGADGNGGGKIDAADYTVWRDNLSTLPGDYNLDGVVDLDDEATWSSAFGGTVLIPGTGADGNWNGVVDAADFTVWRDHLGHRAGAGAPPSIETAGIEMTKVPEPASVTSSYVLCLFLAVARSSFRAITHWRM